MMSHRCQRPRAVLQGPGQTKSSVFATTTFVNDKPDRQLLLLLILLLSPSPLFSRFPQSLRPNPIQTAFPPIPAPLPHHHPPPPPNPATMLRPFLRPLLRAPLLKPAIRPLRPLPRHTFPRTFTTTPLHRFPTDPNKVQPPESQLKAERAKLREEVLTPSDEVSTTSSVRGINEMGPAEASAMRDVDLGKGIESELVSPLEPSQQNHCAHTNVSYLDSVKIEDRPKKGMVVLTGSRV